MASDIVSESIVPTVSLNYSLIPLPKIRAKSLKPSISDGFYDLSTWSPTILSTSMLIHFAGALR